MAAQDVSAGASDRATPAVEAWPHWWEKTVGFYKPNRRLLVKSPAFASDSNF